jgi:phosphonate transport system ATP-binding protein
VASLHAVDLALKWFPRIVGMREGQVVFDKPAGEVSPAMLHELYAAEGALLPTQGGASMPLPDAVDEAAVEGARRANVVPLVRPGCR